MANLKEVIYLSNEDYAILVSTGTVTIDGETLVYDENNIYVTPDVLASSANNGLMSVADKVKLDALDDSNLVHKTGDETIIGNKTFISSITYQNNDGVNWSFEGNGSYNAVFKREGAVLFGFGTSEVYFPNAAMPTGNKLIDIGASNHVWKDLYIGGSLKDGNNANFGVALPDTTSYAEDKTIAVEDELTVVERYI